MIAAWTKFWAYGYNYTALWVLVDCSQWTQKVFIIFYFLHYFCWLFYCFHNLYINCHQFFSWLESTSSTCCRIWEHKFSFQEHGKKHTKAQIVPTLVLYSIIHGLFFCQDYEEKTNHVYITVIFLVLLPRCYWNDGLHVSYWLGANTYTGTR